MYYTLRTYSRSQVSMSVTCPCCSLFLIHSSMLICRFCCKGKQKVLSNNSIFGTKLQFFWTVQVFDENFIYFLIFCDSCDIFYVPKILSAIFSPPKFSRRETERENLSRRSPLFPFHREDAPGHSAEGYSHCGGGEEVAATFKNSRLFLGSFVI